MIDIESEVNVMRFRIQYDAGSEMKYAVVSVGSLYVFLAVLGPCFCGGVSAPLFIGCLCLCYHPNSRPKRRHQHD